MSAIYRRELRSYFNGFMGWLFIALITAVFGFCVRSYNFMGLKPNVEANFSSLLVILAFILCISVLTMRCVAEDKRQKTDQLLYSLPVSTTEIILGKYFALVTVLAITFALMLPYPFILNLYTTATSSVNIFSAVSGTLGYFFLCCSLMAIGVFASTVTENQVVSAVLSFGIMVLFLLSSTIATYIPDTAFASLCIIEAVLVILAIVVGVMTRNYWFGLIIGVVTCVGTMAMYLAQQRWFESLFPKMLRAISMFDRFGSFASSIFDITAIIFDISLAALFLFFAVQSMEKRRWS